MRRLVILDSKGRDWSAEPTHYAASENSGPPPKSLCTTKHAHESCANCPMAPFSGRFSSGSDDEVIMIWWGLDRTPLSTSRHTTHLGSQLCLRKDYLVMKVLRHPHRLTSSNTNRTSRCNGYYLGSPKTDVYHPFGSILRVLFGAAIQHIRKLDQHNGFVEGICFYPVGEFMATQPDGKFENMVDD
ncbi:hypothetical protein F5J12DRAFT_853808 [Pisolithus orientalis]|uniref:uncharacterized protein n=1 Tax=Pisolithus orientalis TaxID=936130 RepID=UPI0022254430|nr:uncharacterized protein F5J12DRAFT_853808 [Pisolithus orientalis]KAI5996482.1 hypothetical protein F5J12DRAFT_853808 [Pisolithus orientalis]